MPFWKNAKLWGQQKINDFSPSDQWWWHVHVTTTVDTNHKH